MFQGQLGCQGSIKSAKRSILKQFPPRNDRVATAGENKDIKNHDKFREIREKY